jgi:FKBP-type peptidyl-prolyl cis-trans isomerase
MLRVIGAICVFLTLSAIGCGGSPDTSSTFAYRAFHYPYRVYDDKIDERSVKGYLKPGENGLVGPELKPVFPSVPPPEYLSWVELIDSRSVFARSGDRVTVQYVGFLYGSKKKFVSSWDEGKPFTFTLGKGEAIRGWEQGLRRMEIGDRREIVIPPRLATGGSRMKNFPSGATLVFVVEVLAINKS